MPKAARPRCPVCGRDTQAVEAAPLPFCSKACKLVDLGRWLDGSYRIPGPPVSMAEIDVDRKAGDGE